MTSAFEKRVKYTLAVKKMMGKKAARDQQARMGWGERGGGGQKANQAVDEDLEVGGQATTHVERLRLFG